MHPLIAHQQNGKCKEVAIYTMYWDMEEKRLKLLKHAHLLLIKHNAHHIRYKFRALIHS